MQFKAFVVLASGLSAVTAWTVPEGTANGVYEVSTDEAGVEIHTLISPPVQTTFKPRGTGVKGGNVKRVLPQSGNDLGCRNSALLQGNADPAVQALKNQCQGGPTGGGQVPALKDFYSVFGDVVAYVCNESILENHCYVDEIQDAIQGRITGHCGAYEGGFDIVADRALEYGYGHTNDKFCGRGI